MNAKWFLRWSAALCLSAVALWADDASQVDRLKNELRQLQENFEKIRQQQQQQIDALSKKLDELTGATAVAPSPSEPKNTERQKLEQQLAADLAANSPPSSSSAAAEKRVPATESASSPIPTMRAGSAYMNISFGTLMDAGWSNRYP